MLGGWGHDGVGEDSGIRDYVYGRLRGHLRNLHGSEPPTPHVPSGNWGDRLAISAAGERPGDVLVRLDADGPDWRRRARFDRHRHSRTVAPARDHVRRHLRRDLSDRIYARAVDLRQSDCRARVPQGSLVVGDGSAGGGSSRRPFRPGPLDSTGVAELDMGRPHRGACRLGLLSHPLFYTIGYARGLRRGDAAQTLEG